MNFRVLESLPVYETMATNFGTNGEQGFVVEFFPEDSKLNWTGNFSLGINTFCKVIEHPNRKDVLVISGGDILVVNPYTKTLEEEMSSMVNSVQELPSQELLCASDLDIVLINQNGLKWKSTRLSPDGLKIERIESEIIFGKSLDLSGDWFDWQVNLVTGKCISGYKCPL